MMWPSYQGHNESRFMAVIISSRVGLHNLAHGCFDKIAGARSNNYPLNYDLAGQFPILIRQTFYLFAQTSAQPPPLWANFFVMELLRRCHYYATATWWTTTGADHLSTTVASCDHVVVVWYGTLLASLSIAIDKTNMRAAVSIYLFRSTHLVLWCLRRSQTMRTFILKTIWTSKDWNVYSCSMR